MLHRLFPGALDIRIKCEPQNRGAQFGDVRIGTRTRGEYINCAGNRFRRELFEEVNVMPKVRNILPKKEHEPGRAMRPFTHSMEEFFESAFPRRWMEGFFDPYAWRRPFFTEFDEKFDVFPKIDMIDKDDKLVVRADVPGIKKEDLEITISGDRLIIEAKRDYEKEEKKEEFVHHEMAYGRLYRSVLLPFEVLGDKAEAEMKDGVLEIVLPKVEATTPYKVKVA